MPPAPRETPTPLVPVLPVPVLAAAIVPPLITVPAVPVMLTPAWGPDIRAAVAPAVPLLMVPPAPGDTPMPLVPVLSAAIVPKLTTKPFVLEMLMPARRPEIRAAVLPKVPLFTIPPAPREIPIPSLPVPRIVPQLLTLPKKLDIATP